MPTADQRAGRRRTPATDEDDWLRPEAGPASDHPLVLTADIELLDSVLAATAAAGAEPTVSDSTAAIRSLWSAAPMVVIGADRARGVAELLLPHRTEVYVVGPDNKVEAKPVELGPLSDGLRVIEKGLDKGDRVIVRGMQRVQAGVVVDPQPEAAITAPAGEKK